MIQPRRKRLDADARTAVAGIIAAVAPQRLIILIPRLYRQPIGLEGMVRPRFARERDLADSIVALLPGDGDRDLFLLAAGFERVDDGEEGVVGGAFGEGFLAGALDAVDADFVVGAFAGVADGDAVGVRAAGDGPRFQGYVALTAGAVEESLVVAGPGPEIALSELIGGIG